MKTLAIRVDAGTNLGMGHLMRCYSISLSLRDSHRVHFYLMETDQPVRTFLEKHELAHTFLPRTDDPMRDAEQFVQQLPASCEVLLDSYSLKTEWQQWIKKAGHRLMVIDDLHAWHHVADHIINHGGGVTAAMYSCEPYTQLHLGYAYRMLRPAFMQGPAPRIQPPRFPGQVIISMGASDVPNNTLKLARACVQFSAEMQVHLLVSRLNPHFEDIQLWVHQHETQARLHLDLSDQPLFDLMAQSDALICPASTIALEGCSVGMLVFAGTTADNQMDNYRGLVEKGMVYPLEDINTKSEQNIIDLIKKNTFEKAEITRMLAEQMKHLAPTKNALTSLFQNEYQLRRARKEDLMLLFEWANDPAVRINSFNQNPISLQEHTLWFHKCLSSENRIIYILYSGDRNIGMIRFDLQEEEAILNFSICKNQRAKGFGKLIVQLGISKFFQENPKVNQVTAYVLNHNLASQKIFSNFDIVDSDKPSSLKYVLLNPNPSN